MEVAVGERQDSLALGRNVTSTRLDSIRSGFVDIGSNAQTNRHHSFFPCPTSFSCSSFLPFHSSTLHLPHHHRTTFHSFAKNFSNFRNFVLIESNPTSVHTIQGHCLNQLF
jgi:hypothetical protein